MFGSTFGQQARNIRRYLAAGTPGAGLQDIVISVMFWIHVPVPPQVRSYVPNAWVLAVSPDPSARRPTQMRRRIPNAPSALLY